MNRNAGQVQFDGYVEAVLKESEVHIEHQLWVSGDILAVTVPSESVGKARGILPLLQKRADEHGFRIEINEVGANFGTEGTAMSPR